MAAGNSLRANNSFAPSLESLGLASGGSGLGSMLPLSCARAALTPDRTADSSRGMRIRRGTIDSLYSAKMTRKQPLEIKSRVERRPAPGQARPDAEIVGLLKAQLGGFHRAQESCRGSPREYRARRLTVALRASVGGLALAQMIGQRQRHAVAQFRRGNFFRGIEQDASVAAIAELGRVQFAEGRDQVGLAMEINRVLVGGGFHPIDPNGAAAFRRGRQITRLSPFQGFLQYADARRGLGGVENQPTQRQQLCLQRFRIGAEHRLNRGI